MTPEQRTAAIERMACAYYTGTDPVSDLASFPPHIRHDSRVLATAFLDALLVDHVVLHRDDVTEGYGTAYGDGSFLYCHARERATHSHLVSRWEPIAKEQDAADR